MKAGDRVKVVRAVGDEAMPDLIGMEGVIEEVYQIPDPFEFSVHLDGDSTTETYVFHREELEVI